MVNRNLRAILLLGLGFAAMACSRVVAEIPEEDETQKVAEFDDSRYYVPGRIVVEFSEEMISLFESDLAQGQVRSTKSNVFNSVLADLGVVSVERVFPDAGEWEPRHREAGLHRWYYLNYDQDAPAARTKSVSAIDILRSIDGVCYADRQPQIKRTAFFNDEYLDMQWQYVNDGHMSYSEAGSDINVLPVWQNYTCGSKNVIVSVVDEGIQMNHPDLVAAVIPGGENGSKNFVSGYEGYNITPGDHGTHVAGTIGAVNNNKIGVCGIAGGNDGTGGVRLMSCEIFMEDPADRNNTFNGNSNSAIVWGADHGAVISQNSWGYVYKTAAEAKRGGVGATKAAIDYFIKYAGTDKNGNQIGPMKGGLVIFAAGNDNWPDGWPAEYSAVEPRCVSVGSIGPAFRKASYSNYGDWVSICAPGGDYSTAGQNGEILSCYSHSNYGYMQGTSMACPHVSGVAALIVSYYGGPGFTNDMLLERLLGGADLDPVRYQRVGPKVDAYGSFTYGGTIAPDKVTSVTPSIKSNFISANWNVTKDEDDKKAYGYLMIAAESEAALSGLDYKNLPSSLKYTVVEVGEIEVGGEISATISGAKFNTDYYVTVVGYDYAKNYAEKSTPVKVTTLSNTKPVIESDYTGDGIVRAYMNQMIKFAVSDPDGHSFEIEHVAGSSAEEFQINKGIEGILTISGKAAAPGKYTSRIIAKDEFGAQTEYDFDYEITPNQAPVLVNPFENIIFTKTGEYMVVDMDEHVTDPDGEVLTFEITTSGNNVVHLMPEGNKLNVTALSYGMVDIIIVAHDTCGESVRFEFKVLVRDSSRQVDVYPNPVKNDMFVRTSEEESITVRVLNGLGSLKYEGTAVVSAFNPLKVDMSKLDPGVYSVVVKGDNVDYSCKIVKL